jgi:FKBP-type peptidyl-prolyl cis-trans isomerase
VLQGIAKAADGIQVLDEKEGFGQHAVSQGDLVLVHYTGDQTAAAVNSSTHARAP